MCADEASFGAFAWSAALGVTCRGCIPQTIAPWFLGRRSNGSAGVNARDLPSSAFAANVGRSDRTRNPQLTSARAGRARRIPARGSISNRQAGRIGCGPATYRERYLISNPLQPLRQPSRGSFRILAVVVIPAQFVVHTPVPEDVIRDHQHAMSHGHGGTLTSTA